MDGFFLIDKEKKMTSYDVVHEMKKKLKMKKIGHTGTLDPDTTGLLVVACGRATKFIPIISDEKIKVYEAEITFGIHTDTYDISGEVIEENKIEVNNAMIDTIIEDFIGKQEQRPPIYSAKKVNGKRLYDYARNNQEVEIKNQKIEVFEIKRLNDVSENKVKVSFTVSKGTYIRSLIVDIAKAMGTIGTMSELRRLSTDGMDVTAAKKLEQISKEDILDLETYVENKYPVYEVYGKIAKLIENGAKLRYRSEMEFPCLYRNQETGKLIALYDQIDDENIKPKVMF